MVETEKVRFFVTLETWWQFVFHASAHQKKMDVGAVEEHVVISCIVNPVFLCSRTSCSRNVCVTCGISRVLVLQASAHQKNLYCCVLGLCAPEELVLLFHPL